MFLVPTVSLNSCSATMVSPDNAVLALKYECSVNSSSLTVLSPTLNAQVFIAHFVLPQQPEEGSMKEILLSYRQIGEIKIKKGDWLSTNL